MLSAALFFLMFQVRGVVSDPAGHPVEGAKVSCPTATATSNSQGQFEIAQTCDATISKSGFITAKAALTASGPNAIQLMLPSVTTDVIVTATGAWLPTDQAGVAASVFTARDFDAPHVPFVADLLRDVPGLNVVQNGSNGALTTLFARGGDSGAALVLLDGVPLTDPGGSLDLAHLTSAGLDRMEVVRGPESAIFGAEASSAVIQMFTRHGDPEATVPHGSIEYDRGSFSTDHWSAALDGGFARRFDYALTADQFRSTGEYSNSAYRITSGTGNLGFRISNKTQLRAVYREFDSYTGVPGQTAYGLIDYNATELARDSALSVRLDDARTSSFTQHVQFGYHRYRFFDNDHDLENYDVAAILKTVPGPSYPYTYLVALANPANPTAPPGTFFIDSPQTLFPFPSVNLTDRTDASYQGTWKHPGGTLVFGYQFERQAGLISGSNVARYDNGFFANEQLSLTQRIFINAGARVQQSSTFGTEFTPRAAITFRLPTDTYLRFSASRGIKEPQLIQDFAREFFFVGNPNLKPETNDAYEAGLSRDWFRSRMKTEASVFRNSFKDLIEFDFSQNPATWINIDKSWARGVELSGSVKLTYFATVHAAYTRLFTRITKDADPTQIGQELVRRPRNTGTVSLELSRRRWSFAAGARFVGERQEDDFVFFAINRNPGYTFVYANASWQATRHIEPFARIENALNANYQEVLGYAALSRNGAGGVKVTW
jgi:vitamin B12 transporter